MLGVHALEEVESAVTQLSEQQRQIVSLLRSVQHARAAFDIADKRYRASADSYQSVLENQRILFQLRQRIAPEEVKAQV